MTIKYWQDGKILNRQLGLTMRTPGQDSDLIVGYLFSESIISDKGDIYEIKSRKSCEVSRSETIELALSPTATIDPKNLDRFGFISSACGFCGKLALPQPVRPITQSAVMNLKTLMTLSQKLKPHLLGFAETGGMHSASLWNLSGKLYLVREDVGRHNALDKLIGAALLGGVSFDNRLLLLSGRVSYELVQKAGVAGIPIIAAVGAPSTLAIETAENYGLTVIGFLKNSGFNVYCGRERLSDET